jgi:ketosteroid isomerase-like protein
MQRKQTMNTIEDELALRNLMGRYTDAVNRRDADAWIATWAEDGVWNLLGSPVTGRNDILALWLQMMGGFEFALMLPSSGVFDINGDHASGHWYLHEYTRDHEGNTSTMVSRYLDTYVKQGDQWLFQLREYSFIYNGPSDMSGTYTPPLG